MSTPDSQEKQKSPEPMDSGDKSVSKAERKASGEAEIGKDNYYEFITKEARALKKARESGVRTETHKEFGTPTIEGDKGTLIPGGAPSPATITDALRQPLTKDASAQGSAEQTGKVLDYKVVQESKSSFALGMDYEDNAPDTRTPIDKLGDFMQAATRRATDPEGWKAWAQGEIGKFGGIGAGLNEAKHETKAAVVAGWKALTDDTVVAFLSQPNAINAPVFKTVATAFDALSKDPNAVNKAFESLGHVVMKASEGYTKLPDHERGKVIGKIMFGMVNPEGRTEGAEAALKVADQVATHLDKTVWNAIDQTMVAIKDMPPDLASQTKQALYDYVKSNGVSASELKSAGIPEGYFDVLIDGEKPSLAGTPTGDWTRLNEQPFPTAVKQFHPNSCVSATGEMLTNGSVNQETLIKELAKYWPPEMLAKMKHPTADLSWLAKELGSSFEFKTFDPLKSDSLLELKAPCATELKGQGGIAHAVVVDGRSPTGNILIRDPYEATAYEMTTDEFIEYWNGRIVRRTGK